MPATPEKTTLRGRRISPHAGAPLTGPGAAPLLDRSAALSASPQSQRLSHDLGHLFTHARGTGRGPAMSWPGFRLSEPEDAGERHANLLAEQALRMPEARAEGQTGGTCQCGGTCPKCQKQRADSGRTETRSVPANDHSLQAGSPDLREALQAPGAPLDLATRHFFEPRFGHDFSRVRVHTSERAGNSAEAFGARAYTAGPHVVFGPGEYQPYSAEGRRLLAHELAHVVQPRGDHGTIWRQPKPPAASDKDFRDFVHATITQFNASAGFYGDPLVKVDATLFEKLINSWYSMVIDREKMIKDQLAGDVLLERDLQSAYTAAIRVLMTKGAKALGKNEDDLYRENSGRIPMWAWQTPHRQEAGIATPLAPGQSPDPITGNVGFTASAGLKVTILPDGFDPSLDKAETSFNITIGNTAFHSRPQGGQNIIDDFTSPTLEATIQTIFTSKAPPGGTSGYGRGTTTQDIAGGKVTPESTSIRFHEASHGLDFVEFLNKNAPPVFTGAKGMTEAQFRAAAAQFKQDVGRYVDRAKAFTSARTHCVGTTIDQFNQAKAAPGATITLECKP